MSLPVAAPPVTSIEVSRPLDLEALYRAHASTVARWSAHLGGSSADLDDLVHEIFLVAGRRLNEFRGHAKVTTWLYRITERVVAARRRSDRVRRWLRRTRRADVVSALCSAPLTPVEDLHRHQARAAVYQVLDRLPEKYRSVLILFELEGLSGEEIAALTGRKLATVWVHLHRARARFLAELPRQEEEEVDQEQGEEATR
jgi:RNA polymerase sigma-70 factor (ECF subfamily)